MTGCRVGAKNTLDQNYLYLAERRGAVVRPETEVRAVRPASGGGYVVETNASESIAAAQVVFAGGVMGTIPLLLAMQADPAGLPKLSARVGDAVRTNNESLIGVVAPQSGHDFSKGVAVTSILHTDEHSHVEPVRYGAGSGFFRALTLPHSPGASALARVAGTVGALAREPKKWARALLAGDFARQSQILLYMRALEGSMRLRLGRRLRPGGPRRLVSELAPGTAAPRAFIPEATDLAERFAAKVGGVTTTLFSETLLGTPTTAHILGGACMGKSAEDGVIDHRHRVFGYDGLYVIDGSAISANPGVNPSLTICALAERAMSFVPVKG
jgi:cholesterol oxidase